MSRGERYDPIYRGCAPITSIPAGMTGAMMAHILRRKVKIKKAKLLSEHGHAKRWKRKRGLQPDKPPWQE